MLRALGEVAGLVNGERAAADTRGRDGMTASDAGSEGNLPNVTSIERARRRGGKDGKKTGR